MAKNIDEDYLEAEPIERRIPTVVPETVPTMVPEPGTGGPSAGYQKGGGQTTAEEQSMHELSLMRGRMYDIPDDV